MRNLQQRGLLADVGFDTLVEVLFRLDALADILNDTQQARLVLINECRPAPLALNVAPSRRTCSTRVSNTPPDRNARRNLLKTFWLSGWMNAAGNSPMNSVRA